MDALPFFHTEYAHDLVTFNGVNYSGVSGEIGGWPRKPVRDSSDAATPRRRLRVNGTHVTSLSDPDTPVLLRGFTFDFIWNKPGMASVTQQDRDVKTLLPGTNLARLVMVHWHDDGTTATGHDCAANTAETGYLTAACLDQFDSVLKWATQEAGMWAIVTMRGALAAGDGGEGRTVWSNATLRAQLVSMWGFLAQRYEGLGGVAGFEVMSEPRWDGSAAAVHQFHADACQAVWASDADAVCFIGAAPYYDRYNLGPQYLLPGNVIYAANFFEPKAWISNGPAARAVPYGSSGPCCAFAEKRSCGRCPGEQVTLGRPWLESLMQPVVDFGAEHRVPVWIDQWGVHSDAGAVAGDRARYLRDTLSLFNSSQLHWSQWIWRRPLCGQDEFSIVCERPNGTFAHFVTAIDELSKWLG